MADISKVTLPNNSAYNLKDSTARTDIGTLSNLYTEEKSSLVGAINEVCSIIWDINDALEEVLGNADG